MRPLISVAMATYNGEKFLRKQLDSIFAQTYKNIELIVCDDCSSDNTQAILNEYLEKHSNMKVFVNEKNLGYIKNFEKAIMNCNGKYISISDQDDIWVENKIEFLYNAIENYKVVCSKEDSIDESDNKIAIPNTYLQRFKLAKNNKQDEIYFISLIDKNILAGCTSLIETSFLKNITPFPTELTYDHWICLNAYCINSLKFVDEFTIYHRKHHNNISFTNKRKQQNEQQIKIYKNKAKIPEIIKNRICVPEEYLAMLDKYSEILCSIEHFKFTPKDILLIKDQYDLYMKMGKSFYSYIKTIVKRIINFLKNN